MISPLIISHCRDWLIKKIKNEVEKWILLKFIGVLIHFLLRA